MQPKGQMSSGTTRDTGDLHGVPVPFYYKYKVHSSGVTNPVLLNKWVCACASAYDRGIYGLPTFT